MPFVIYYGDTVITSVNASSVVIKYFSDQRTIATISSSQGIILSTQNIYCQYNITIGNVQLNTANKFLQQNITVRYGEEKSWSMYTVTAYGYTIDASVPNPDSSIYQGVYKSENYHIGSSYAVVQLTFKGYPNFELYIRSNAEGSYDYIMASNMDLSSYPTYAEDTSYPAKAHTKGNQQSATSLSAYTKVEYPNDGGQHHIYIVFRKDSSVDSGEDRGFFFFKK